MQATKSGPIRFGPPYFDLSKALEKTARDSSPGEVEFMVGNSAASSQTVSVKIYSLAKTEGQEKTVDFTGFVDDGACYGTYCFRDQSGLFTLPDE